MLHPSKAVIIILSLFCLGLYAENTFTPGKWFRWPANGPAVTVSTGSWMFGGNDGHTGFALNVEPGKFLRELSFEYRSAETTGGKHVEFHIVEKSGESFYCRFKPEKEWNKLTVAPEKLRIFPYGGAKILDGKLDLTKIKQIKFNGTFRNNRFEIRNFKISCGSLSDSPESQTESRKIIYPASEYTSAGKWIKFDPKNKFSITPVDQEGKKAVRLDLLNADGHIGIRFPHLPGYVPEQVILKLKAEPENRTTALRVLFREQDEESYGCRIQLDKQWKNFIFKLPEMKLYRDGGAHIADGKLDPARIRFMRFHNYPAGHCFLLGDIEVIYRPQTPAEKEAAEKSASAYTVKKIILPETFERKDRFYPGVGKIKIADGHFKKNGKSSFLLGGWPLDADANPLIMRTLGIDFYVCNADEIYSLYKPKLKNGIPEVSWREMPWMHSHINRFLANNIDFWLEHKSHARYNALRLDRRFKEILDAGHMVSYDPFNPAGVEMYREMFKSTMRYSREYPLFCYELFNEMCYDNTHKISREAFKEAMKKKYDNNIRKANSIWGTAFASFQDIRIPGFMSDDGKNDLPRVELRHREADKHPALYADFHRFQELRCIEAVKKMMPVMRQYDPAGMTYSTVQSHMSLSTDHGEHGVTPEALTVSSDFVTHEAGLHFLESDTPSFSAVAGMMKPLFFYDAMRYFSKGKPVINGEAPILVGRQSADIHELALQDLAALPGIWKFYDATAKIPEGWMQSDYNDTAWKEIQVPGMWGQQGFPKCQVGLYRKKFMISSLPADKKIYLNGNAIADEGEVYCNGRLIGKSSGFGKKFAMELTSSLRTGENQLAIRVVNRFIHDNMYYGGLRGQLSVNPVPLITDAPAPEMEQRHIRSFLWSQVLHGLHGVVICYNTPLFSSAGRIMPFVKKEINNVADLLLTPGNLQTGDCAIVYPEETFRLIRHRKYLEKMRGPATLDLMPYYMALRFSGMSPSVIRFKDLSALSGKLRLVVAPNAARIGKKELEELKNFVRNGGILLTDFNSFKTEDFSHEKLNEQVFTGIQTGGTITASGKMKFSGLLSAEGYLQKHFLANSTGREIKLLSAKPLLWAGKNIALTENKYGKGKVYCMTVHPEGKIHEKIVRKIAELSQIHPLIRAVPLGSQEGCPAVDLAVFKDKNDSILLAATALGTPGVYRLTPSKQLLPSENYRVRFTHSGKSIPAPAGREFWSREELISGLRLNFKRFDPIVLLLEPQEKEGRTLSGLSPERVAIAENLWKKEPEKKNAPVVSFSPVNGMEKTFGTLPTARKMIADQGFNCRDFSSAKDIEKSDIIIWSFPKFPCPAPEKLIERVRDGAGLLLCGGAVLHYHSINNNQKLFSKAGLAEGYGVGSAVFNNNIRLPEFDNMTIQIPVKENHVISNGVKEVIFLMSNRLTKYPANAEILLRAPETSSHPGAVLAVAFKLGKGRVVYVADHVFLRPGNLERGDNARFLANIIAWLGKREPQTDKINKSLFVTAAKLKEAEDKENRIHPLKFPEDTPTYLNRSDAPRGLAGGDPVLDALKAL